MNGKSTKIYLATNVLTRRYQNENT